MGEFSNVLYENIHEIDGKDVAQSLKRLTDMVTSTKKNQTSLYGPLILIINDIFDAYGPADMNQ